MVVVVSKDTWEEKRETHELGEGGYQSVSASSFSIFSMHLKLLLNKPQYLTSRCKKGIRLLTRFLEVPYQGDMVFNNYATISYTKIQSKFWSCNWPHARSRVYKSANLGRVRSAQVFELLQCNRDAHPGLDHAHLSIRHKLTTPQVPIHVSLRRSRDELQIIP